MRSQRDNEDVLKVWILRYNILGFLLLAHFLIHRCRVLVNKLTYLLVSFLTAFKNRKQHIRNTWLCVVLQMTLLLPWFGGVLLWTTFFDIAMLPTFGFAFFTAGYLKPLRCWSVISPVEANPKE